MFPELTEIGKYFHEMFKFRWDEYRRSGFSLVVNPMKRRKKFTNEEGLIYKPLDFEIFGNISAFGIYEISRLAVFEKFLRRTSYLQMHLRMLADSSEECVTPNEMNNLQARIESSETLDVSKVVKIGVRSIFELIKYSKDDYPDLCVKAVSSLLTLLEGLELEALSNEPADVIDDIFGILLSVVDECLNESRETDDNINRLVEMSSACLLSFAIIRGDTGKMLRAITTILISKFSSFHMMVLPNAVIELQKSVQSIITGKLKHPHWFTHGVLKSSCICSFRLLLSSDDAVKMPLKIKNIACDGYFLYIYTTSGLYKIGTGYNGTIPRHIYAYNSAFFGQESGWIGYVKETLYFVLMKPKGVNEIYSVNTTTLELKNLIRIDESVVNISKGSLFVDGDFMCILTSPEENVLTVRYLEFCDSKIIVSPNDLYLRLSEKYFKLLRAASESEEKILSSNNVGVHEELVAFVSGKEFSLLQTASGKVLYNSKLGNQNLRAPGSQDTQCWVELTCPKISVVKQCIIGNEGSIGLLVYNDGSVYFIGFARRGEDGENGVVRRQCNQIKPRKMTRMEGKFVTYAACNHGSTALVTDKGELYMFGKDAVHCEAGTGFVSDLKNVRVRQVALGKVHVVVLTDKGFVYTFGYNGRGQCGRCFSTQDAKQYEAFVDVLDEDDELSGSSEDTYSDIICPKGTHLFKQDKCMICPICRQCTGYGAGCLASNEEDREPGEECGCGDGDSGCAKCCICKICAFEEDPEQELGEDNYADDLMKINLFGAVYERNEKKVFSRFNKKENESVPSSSKDVRCKGTVSNADSSGQDSINIVYLSPGRVYFRTNVPAIQICTGLYHSVILMENGEVYTFGNNACGQLGISDTCHVGPVKVNLPSVIIQIAAGSNHSVALTSTGEVYTFGNNVVNRPEENNPIFVQIDSSRWNNGPKLIPQIGAQYQEKAIGIGASGDLTYLKINKNLINASTLQMSVFVSDKNYILLLPTKSENNHPKRFECIAVEKVNGSFRSFHGSDQVDFSNCVVCFDSLYNVLWSVHEADSGNLEQGTVVNCYNVIASDVKEEFCSPNILDCELAVPVIPLHPLPCFQTAIHVLACLNMLAQARFQKDALKSLFNEQKCVVNTKSLRKEEFNIVNRFQTLGNSWTYNTHNAVEAIRVSCDTDVLLGGIGLYGGRGHYHAKINLFDIGFETDRELKDGQLIMSIDEIVYECSLKQIYSLMFEQSVLLQANRWYIVWAQIKGSPSDCGTSGQSYVVTDDEVIFHFKSSLLSNNGTTVSSGQIPQLLYKVLQPEYFVVTNLENISSTVHILSKKFSHTVSENGFKSLIDLLSWCWEAFKQKYAEISNLRFSPLLLESVREFDRLVYINQACQHLIKAFIFEMYPDDRHARERRSRINYVMAGLIGDARELLQNILSDPFIFEYFIPKKEEDGSNNIFYRLVKHIVKECSDTFISCFYVFYPSPMQKWIYMCYLLTYEPENEFEHDFLITATFSAMYASNINLKSIFPILLGAFDLNQLHHQNKQSNLTSMNFCDQYPVLTECMMTRTENEIRVTVCSWLYIVEKILQMAVQPVKDALHGICNEHDSQIAFNSCHILSKLVAELSAEAMGINDEVQRRKEQMLHTTPIRFRRVNGNKSWNTGNGSPDAICFTVDKPGVVIVGIGVFGGSGNYDYEIELMDEMTTKGKNNSDYNLSNPHAHWKCVAMCRGSFCSSDYNGKDIVELNFEYPTTIQENSKYVIKLRLRGNRTHNGELGQAVVTGPDDTVFTYLNTDLSFNGTSISRGQLPYIIYYRYPKRSSEELKQKISLENQAREAIITISSQIFFEVKAILKDIDNGSGYKDTADIVVETPFIKILIPLLVTHLSPLVALSPENACQVLKLIEQILPLVCRLNKQVYVNTRDPVLVADNVSTSQITPNILTTSPHYSMVESDHPYKKATVTKYIVKFPESVLWLSLEFDPRCGTTQEEDVLKIYVPDSAKEYCKNSRKLYRPLPRAYGNKRTSWPGTAIILPGNEVIFSLETASKYSSHDRGTSFGFKCLVIGFEMVNIDGFPRLELELNVLACRCASHLIKKKFINGLNEDEFSAENINLELAEADYHVHSSILNRGLDLCRKDVMNQDQLNFRSSGIWSNTNHSDSLKTKFLSNGSNEQTFLMDFIHYKSCTNGGRLARWLQPDSFVDVSNCEVILPRVNVKCGWPTSLAVVTRDQHRDIVEVPNLKVKVVCISLTKIDLTSNRKSEADDKANKLDLAVPYKPISTNRVRYIAITFMKEYSGYSFEELRYATPTVTHHEEELTVHSNYNGIYTAKWTPKEAGFYSVLVEIDGLVIPDVNKKIEVKMPPFGLKAPTYNKSSSTLYAGKKLKFIKKYSAALRIRAQPSLQAEQIGIVFQNGTVTFNDEAENEDGIWVKLTHESITQYCKLLFPEAWCLKYNKHYETELLLAYNNQINENSTGSINVEEGMKTYQVIKCGVSGHNIRAYPSLKAPTVGMIFAEQTVTSDEQIYNKEGMWIKLDKGTLKKLDPNLLQYDGVWSLAVDKSQIIYLKSDVDSHKECTGKKQRYSRSVSRNSVSVVSVSKTSVDEPTHKIDENQINNQNLINFNVPPTPKKQRKLSSSLSEKTDCSIGVTNLSDLADVSSNCSSGSGSARSASPQYENFIEKLERATNECRSFGICGISDNSGGISSGYQASIETSSDSAVIFSKSEDRFHEEKQQTTLAQTGTQTSPKIFPKIVCRRQSDRSTEYKPFSAPSNFKPSNVNVQVQTTQNSSRSLFDIDKFFEDTVMQVETIERVPLGRRKSVNPSVEVIDADDRISVSSDRDSNEDEKDSLLSVETKAEHKFSNNDFGIKELMTFDKSSSESLCSTNGNLREYPQREFFIDNERMLDFEYFQFSVSEIEQNDRIMVVENIEEDMEKLIYVKEEKVQCKTGMSPSVAESVRAVFAAFLWHEGLVHDAMTCASFLKFHPELRKDQDLVIRREHKRSKDATQRYSVEVGLSGNCHHIIKPSSMRSLPSSNKNNPSSSNKENVPKIPHLALDYVSILWNEISSICFQLFSKSDSPSAANKLNNDNHEIRSSSGSVTQFDDNKKYISKWASDFNKKFGTEDVCELCNLKFPFPVTHHMRMAHKGCGKLGVTKGYTLNGKFSTKLKGNCGEGGKKSSPWYILCDVCREQYLQVRKMKVSPFAGFSPTNEEESISVRGSIEMHLMMRANALFALELSGNYNKLLPVVETLPRLKTFECLQSFGIDGNVIPTDLNSFTLEVEKKINSRDEDADSEKERTINVVNSFQKSVSMIGHTWKIDDNDIENRPLTSAPNKRFSVVYDLESSILSERSHSSARLDNILKDLRSLDGSNKLDKPILAFLKEYHNLKNLKSAMKLTIKKAIYKNYGLRAMDWLLRTVTIPMALHDIMWWFISSFSIPLRNEGNVCENDGEWNDEFELTRICEHPLVDMALAGEARQHIPSSFHTLLQTIADLMLIFPTGSPLQQMAIKCWGFQFTQSDYNFLHRSKLFVNISKILSRSESEEEQEYTTSSLYESHSSAVSQSDHYVEILRDITCHVTITVSSQPQLIQNLTDNSTETYWESAEEDRKKMKTIIINCPAEVNSRIIYVHADNTRDTNHKLLSAMILTGTYADSPKKLRSVNLDADFCGWITTFIPEPNQRMIRIDCKGDNSIRIRQIKVAGEVERESPRILQMPCSFILQQRQCEYETLKVFRLIIFQVFGELLENSQYDVQRDSEQRGSSDLKEHMVGILFSRRKLNNLQKQVCTHIVQTIKRETYVIKEEWERNTSVTLPGVDNVQCDINDSYCFEMLCMVSALSGSDVGRSHLAQQFDLISDLLTLLHVGTTRLQRQVVLLLKRVLPEVSPVMLAEIMGIQSLPTVDFRSLVSNAASSCDLNKHGILDIFLAVIAKSLCMQMKAKNGSNGKGVKTIFMTDYIHPQNMDSSRWYFKGTISKEFSADVDALLKDMSRGKMSYNWQEITKAEIAENILNLANLSKITKDHNQCLNFPVFWIGLASLSVLDVEHVEKLSSANWRNENNETTSSRPLCTNHDDGKTLAVMHCNICGLLCLECDRFLHLSRRTDNHERRVCKEEEESIKVDLHEGCGRVKLFWLLALVDSNTFKGVVEFRENTRDLGVINQKGVNSEMCRFCGRSSVKLSENSACYEEECLLYASNACNKIHLCGHICGGIKNEEKCLPCLRGCSTGILSLKQDADDMCMICFTEALSAAPSIQLECGHVFHYHCCRSVLLRRWPGPRITFNFQQCPICKRSMYHQALEELLAPISELMKEVRKKALMRLEYEGCPSNYEDPAVYAMEKYAYYVCFKCKKAYYGGEARCEVEVDNSDFNSEELICGGCSDVSGARVCPKHGTDFLEYKCRYCCSVAVYFCFGTTHFCNACHEDFQKVIYLSPAELPSCPAGPKGTFLKVEDCPLHIKHPPTGEEYALGCGVCRTGRTF